MDNDGSVGSRHVILHPDSNAPSIFEKTDAERVAVGGPFRVVKLADLSPFANGLESGQTLREKIEETAADSEVRVAEGRVGEVG